MKVEQIYTGCLAEAAYYIESKGEVAIIDPLRDPKPYIAKATENGAKIKYVIETHFHADFVSGHLDLAAATGATIVYGPTAKPNYNVHIAQDGEDLKIGDITLRVLHTPGHTMESTTYLLIDENGKEYAIFTGDTLFIGDVGRPDLAIKSDLTREDLAGLLFDSLRNKIMTLPDSVIVYPGHGAGSACGKNMSKETFDTLGNQKKFNYALRASMTKEEFVKEVTDGLAEPPQYFPKNAVMNKMGYDSFDEVMKRGVIGLSPAEFEAVAEQSGALILDTRPNAQFVKGFIPNSVFIGVDGQFASWVGTLITDLKQPILVVAEEGKEEEVVMRLSRVGYDHTVGYLKGGFEAWKNAGKEIDQIEEIDPAVFAELFKQNPDLNVLDVRRCSEYDSQHVTGVANFPLDHINKNMAELKRDKKYLVHCAGGYRSVIAASILQARGYQVVNIQGGFGVLKNTGLSLTDFQTQKTML